MNKLDRHPAMPWYWYEMPPESQNYYKVKCKTTGKFVKWGSRVDGRNLPEGDILVPYKAPRPLPFLD